MSWTEIKSALRAQDSGIDKDEVNRFAIVAEHSGLMRRDPSAPTYQMPIPPFAGYLLNEPLPEIKAPGQAAEAPS